MAEYEYGSMDSWDIRPKGRTRDSSRHKEEPSEREDDGDRDSHEPKLNGRQ